MTLTGRVIGDARRFGQTCSALISIEHLQGERSDGRVELVLQPCEIAPEQGWRVQVSGVLKHPNPSPHPSLIGTAERLHRLKCWSQIRSEQILVLQQPWTPIADLRRRIARRLQAVAGEQRGGLLAALTVGNAQVQLPAELRQSFRVAGLSHSLAASGFHLSILLGAARALSRRSDKLHFSLSVLALSTFLTLAGAQASVVRAVLMGATTLLIRHSGERSKALGVLTLTLIVMLLIHPAWAGSIGFQLSAAATAGLILTAPMLENHFEDLLPDKLHGLATALSIPIAAMAWTFPLQLLHFGSTPLYALPANLLATPLLTLLTLLAMVSALLSLVMPIPVLTWLIWPVKELAGWLIALTNRISTLPGAQLLTGHPHPSVAVVFLIALMPWLIPQAKAWRGRAFPFALIAIGIHAAHQTSDQVLAGHSFGRHWLLARHGGRAAMVNSHGDERSCQVARRLAHTHGHRQLDWVLVLNRIPGQASTCWKRLARRVLSRQSGRQQLHRGQTLFSPGLSVGIPSEAWGRMELNAGSQRLLLIPSKQALWSLQKEGIHRGDQRPSGVWLGFRSTESQRNWVSAQLGRSGFLLGPRQRRKVPKGRGPKI